VTDTWEYAAERVADRIECYDPDAKRASLDAIDALLDAGEFLEVEDFLAIATDALLSIEQDVWDSTKKDVWDILKTVISKQHDYGHQNILRHGITGVIVRMCDKVERIKNLQRRDKPANESLQDSWGDLVGYSIIAVMLLEGTFGLPLGDDAPKPKPVESFYSLNDVAGGIRTFIDWNGNIYNWSQSAAAWFFAGTEAK
jgi:hypothetical protein